MEQKDKKLRHTIFRLGGYLSSEPKAFETEKAGIICDFMVANKVSSMRRACYVPCACLDEDVAKYILTHFKKNDWIQIVQGIPTQRFDSNQKPRGVKILAWDILHKGEVYNVTDEHGNKLRPTNMRYGGHLVRDPKAIQTKLGMGCDFLISNSTSRKHRSCFVPSVCFDEDVSKYILANFKKGDWMQVVEAVPIPKTDSSGRPFGVKMKVLDLEHKGLSFDEWNNQDLNEGAVEGVDF